jgi:hypothetical protein
MVTRPEGPQRHVTYALGEGARHLAVSCDSVVNGFALDRVLFPNAVVVGIQDVAATSDGD